MRRVPRHWRPLVLFLVFSLTQFALPSVPTLAQSATPVTITIDGVREPAWGSPLASDPVGDMSESNLDLANLYIVDDINNYYIGFDALATAWGMHYGIAIDTDGVSGSGATSNPWGRAVDTVAANRPEYFLNVWHPGNGTIEDAQLNRWDGSAWSFPSLISQGGAQAYSEANSWIEYRVPKSALGGAGQIRVELFTTAGSGHAQDTVPSDPNVAYTSPDFGAAVTTLSAFVSYTGIHIPAADNNVEWNGLRHDSRDTLYRTPGGAVPAGGEVAIRLRTFHNDVTSVTLRLYNINANGQQLLPMSIAASDVSCYQAGLEEESCDYWEAILASSVPNNLWYRFIVSDGSDTDYYGDNTSALDGGLGQTTDDAVDQSYALMFYNPAFSAPAWAKNAVIYQIFPDRFYNGKTNNDPDTGDVRYDDPVIALPWNTLPEGYCRNYANADTSCPWRFDTTPPDSSPSKEQPRGRDYYGGDLRGVIQKLDYLKNMGVTAIYFNPIFAAKSNHRYDTADYMRIDPALGTLAEFQQLVRAADQRGIKIILDSVFNHMSSDSANFDRYRHYSTVGACESASSTYRDWFNFRAPAAGEPAPCAPSTPGGSDTYYAGWFGFDSIPEIKKTNPAVQDYFLFNNRSVSRYWLQQGARGWRLDVMGDPSFPAGYWESFRQIVRNTNPEALIIGELWQKDSTLLRNLRGETADTTMNYRLRDAVLGLLTPGAFDSKGFGDSGRQIEPSEFASRILSIREDYPDAAFYTLMNIVGSHDTERVLWTLTPGAETIAEKQQNAANLADGKRRLQLASLIQYTMPGAPTVYYGDEVGVTGDDDPDDRRTYPWAETGGQPDNTLLQHYRELAQIRHHYTALSQGDLRVLLADDSADTLAYGRALGNNAAIVAFNRSNEVRTFSIPVAGYLPNGTKLQVSYCVGNNYYGWVQVNNGAIQLQLQPMSAMLLTSYQADLTPPAAPGGLQVTNEGSGQVSLSWNAVAGAAGYAIYRSPLSGGGWVKVNNTPVTGTSFTDSGLRNAQTYYYIVKALDAAGNSSKASNEASALPHYELGWANLQWPPTLSHTLSITTRTGNVYGQVWIDGVTGQPGATASLRAQLGYGPQGSDPATSPGWNWTEAQFNVDAGNNDEFVASMLPETTGTFNYAYRYSTTDGRDWVYADLDGIGNGYSPAQAGVLAVTTTDTVAPATPTGLQVVAASSVVGVELAWDAVVGDPSLYGYEVGRGSSASGPFTTLARVTGTNYIDLNVTQGETYYYIVRAIDNAFNRSPDSAPVSAVPELRTVTLQFNVTVPASTDATGRSVYIAGFLNRLDGNLPEWNPGGVVLTQVNATLWQITFTGKETTQIEYKYALGSWDYVEKGAGDCAELGNRQLTLTYGSTGTQVVNNTVENWRNVAPCGN